MTRMNKGLNLRFAIIFVVAVLASGCSSRVADLTVISTKDFDFSNAQFDMKEGRRAKGKSCAVALLGMIPLGIPSLEKAIDLALEQGGGNVMVDQVSYIKYAYFVLISETCIEVEGTVLNVSEAPKSL